MSVQTPAYDEIARVAHAIWEAEGQPQGRDHEHWMRAKRLIEEGRAEFEFPPAEESAPRPVQRGFEHAAPGIVPNKKAEPFDGIQEDAGACLDEQLSELAESAPAAGRTATPGDCAAPGVRDTTGRTIVNEEPDVPSAAVAASKHSRHLANPGR